MTITISCFRNISPKISNFFLVALFCSSVHALDSLFIFKMQEKIFESCITLKYVSFCFLSFYKRFYIVERQNMYGQFMQFSKELTKYMTLQQSKESHKDKFTNLYTSKIWFLTRHSYIFVIQAWRTTQNAFFIFKNLNSRQIVHVKICQLKVCSRYDACFYFFPKASKGVLTLKV